MGTSTIIGLYIIDSFLLAGVCYLCFQSNKFYQFTKLNESDNNDDNYKTFHSEDNV